MSVWIKRTLLLLVIVSAGVCAVFIEQLYRAQLADQQLLDNSAVLRSELRQIDPLSHSVATGQPGAFARLEESDQALYRSWGRLYKQLYSEANGRAQPLPESVRSFAQQLVVLRRELAGLLGQRQAASDWQKLVAASARALPVLEENLAEQVETLIAADAQTATVVLAQQQLWQLQRFDRGLAELVGSEVEKAVLQLQQTAAQINQALQALETIAAGNGAATQFLEVSEALAGFERSLPNFVLLQKGAKRAGSYPQPLLVELDRIEQEIRRRAAQPLWQRAAAPLRWAAITTLLTALLYLLMVWRTARANTRSVRLHQQQQQAELEALISELNAVGEGDLTRQLTAQSGTTAILAESLNSAVEALRRLVAAAARQSLEIGEQSEAQQSASQALQQGAKLQLEQLGAANKTLQQLVASVEATATRARESQKMAEQARQTAAKGALRVAESSVSMGQIDSAIGAAAGSLGELKGSAEQIGKIAAVISEIADQTNVMALNAAIQATGSGDEARGFAVVADEIQRLAESAAGAAAEIAELLSKVAEHSSEADLAMQKSCVELGEGKQRMAAAGEALEAIETSTNELLPIIAEISDSSATQAGQVEQIAARVDEVVRQANATLSGSQANAQSSDQLALLAVEMRRSISHFTLGELTPTNSEEAEQGAAQDEYEANSLEAFEREIEQLLANTPKPGAERE